MSNPEWIDAVRNAPKFSCGRLDMSSYDAETGEMERFVYVEGVEEGKQILGSFCDEIAFAASDYKRLLAERDDLHGQMMSQAENAKRYYELADKLQDRLNSLLKTNV